VGEQPYFQYKLASTSVKSWRNAHRVDCPGTPRTCLGRTKARSKSSPFSDSFLEKTTTCPSAMLNPADSFEPHRRRLLGLAYRMPGSMADAEDAVQETYLRWHAADRDTVSDQRAFLMTTTTRICLDMPTSARAGVRSTWFPGCRSRSLIRQLSRPIVARNWLRICLSRCIHASGDDVNVGRPERQRRHLLRAWRCHPMTATSSC